MRVKWTGDTAVIVPELRDEPVEPGEIVDVDDDVGQRMADNPAWKVTTPPKTTRRPVVDEDEEE